MAVSFSLAMAAMSPGMSCFDRFLGFPFEEEDVSDPLGDLPGGVEDAGVGAERARIDAEEGEAARIGIGDGLEDQG